jgi:hypothetical protein
VVFELRVHVGLPVQLIHDEVEVLVGACRMHGPTSQPVPGFRR